MATLVWDPVNNVWKGTFTVSNDGTGNSNETYTIDLGDMVGPVTVTLNGIDTVLYPGATNSINIVDCSSWNLTASPTTVTEGNTVTLSLSTSGVADGPVPFSITGLQSGDLDVSTGVVTWDGTKYVGSFNLVNNASSPNLTLNVLNDNISDDGEDMTISLVNGKDSATVTINDITQSWNLTATPTTVTEGDTVTLSLSTSGVANGPVPFIIEGLQSGDLDVSTGVVSWDGSKYVGSFNLVNNASSPNLTLNVLNDNISDDGEDMTISLVNGKDSATVTINDPVVVDCCAGMANEIPTTGVFENQTPVNYLSTELFEACGKLCYHTLTSTGAPSLYTVQIGTSDVYGRITTTGNFSDNYVVYVAPDGKCYGGNLDPNPPSGITQLNLI